MEHCDFGDLMGQGYMNAFSGSNKEILPKLVLQWETQLTTTSLGDLDHNGRLNRKEYSKA